MVDLSSPLYDNVLEIDKRLELLYNQVNVIDKQLDEEVEEARKEPPKRIQATQKFLSSSKKDTFKDLPRIQADASKLLSTKAMKPQISKKWKQTIQSTEPRIQQFYDKEFYEPEYSSLEEMKLPFRRTQDFAQKKARLRDREVNAWMQI